MFHMGAMESINIYIKFRSINITQNKVNPLGAVIAFFLLSFPTPIEVIEGNIC